MIYRHVKIDGVSYVSAEENGEIFEVWPMEASPISCRLAMQGNKQI